MSGRNPGTIRERFDVPENAAAARFAPGSRRDDFRATPRYLKLCAAIRSSLRGAGPTEDGATS
jgi:hypothetical protein